MQDQSQLFSAMVHAVAEKQIPRTNPAAPSEPKPRRRGRQRASGDVVMPGPSRRKLAAEIESFLKESGMYQTPFGIAAAKDDKLLWRIKHAPNGISLDKADRIRAFMAKWRQTPGDHPHGDRPQLRKQKA